MTLRELTDANRDESVGLVMLSWNCVPDPPEVFGPWFLWRLLIDARHQRHGYGRDDVRLVADLVRAVGADELLTSFVPGDEAGASLRRDQTCSLRNASQRRSTSA